MQPVTLNAAEVSQWVSRLWWPTLRVGGFFLSAPIASENTIPSFIKIILSVSLAFLMSPLVRVPADLSIFSGTGLFAAVQELLIGVAIGMVVQLAFEALTFAGQSVSLTMGLGFATLVDPQHGANTTVLGQMFMIFGVLTYLAVDGHLMLLGALAQSFQTLPIGVLHADGNFLLSVVSWGAHVFESGRLIALVTGLVIGMLQAATQINEATLSFIPKLLLLVLTLFAVGPWILRVLVDFTRDLYTSIPSVIG